MESNEKLDWSALEDMYRLALMAIMASDGKDSKYLLIDSIEYELKELLHEAEPVMEKLLGPDYIKKLGAMSSAVSSLGLENAMYQMKVDTTALEGLEIEPLFYTANKIASQIGMIVGIVMALKADGTWSRYKESD